MQIKSNVITAVVTAIAVVALTWNPAADASSSQSSAVSVCVNKKSGAMRNASSCKSSERKLEIAQANVKLTVPPPISATELSATRGVKTVPSETELSIADLAGQSVQTVVSHVTVPNEFGRDTTELAGKKIYFPACPENAPVPISYAPYSTNYGEPAVRTSSEYYFANADESRAISFALERGNGWAWFSNPINDFMVTYPKDGDIDLYLVTLCAPILVAP
jgi:hypothetical protein